MIYQNNLNWIKAATAWSGIWQNHSVYQPWLAWFALWVYWLCKARKKLRAETNCTNVRILSVSWSSWYANKTNVHFNSNMDLVGLIKLMTGIFSRYFLSTQFSCSVIQIRIYFWPFLDSGTQIEAKQSLRQFKTKMMGKKVDAGGESRKKCLTI